MFLLLKRNNELDEPMINLNECIIQGYVISYDLQPVQDYCFTLI